MAADLEPPTSGGHDGIVIVDGARTAIGRFGGGLRDVESHILGATAVRAALSRSQLEPEDVDEVVMGQVGQVGEDAYNARRCSIAAGIPTSAGAMNVNRLCSSGLQAIVTGAQQLQTDQADVVVAGGNESMSRQPFLDYGARRGWQLGSREVLDGTLSLVTDPWGRYPMGETAERVAERYGVTREEQDAFAARSQARAVYAQDNGYFDREIVPVDVGTAAAPFAQDEHPRRDATHETLGRLKPVFRSDGTVTAGNSSGINDGAAALIMMKESEAHRRRLTPRLRFCGATVVGVDPEIMGFAPALAIPKLLEKLRLTLDDIDLIELNEAFAAQAVAVIKALDLDESKVNPSGGAIAFGHPIGATGAILTVKLMNALERTDARRGMVTMCMGGGQGMAAVFERIA